MTATIEAPAPTQAPDRSPIAICHTVCCTDEHALCGADVTANEWNFNPAPHEECIVCLEFFDTGKVCASCEASKCCHWSRITGKLVRRHRKK